MPVVQRYGQRQVGLDALPGVRRQAHETAESEGAGLDEAQARTSEAIGGLAGQAANTALGTYAELAKQARQRADQVAVLKADNDLSTWQNTYLYGDGTADNTGALNRKGQAALGLPEEALDAYQAKADAVASTLKTPEQQLAFAKLRSDRRDNLDLTVRRYTSGQMDAYEADELKAKVANGTNEAIQNALDPRASQQALTGTLQAIQTHAANLGLGPEQLQAELARVTSNVRAGVIDNLLANDQVGAAKVYFEETKGDLSGDQLTRVTKALEAGTLKQQTQQATDKILAEHPDATLTQLRDAAKALTDPQLRDEVTKAVEHEYAVRQTAQTDGERETLKSVWNILDQTPDVRQIPTATWANLSPDARAAAYSYAAARVRGVPVKTDLSSWYGLIQMAGTDPAKFVGLNLETYKTKLDPSDFESMGNLQLTMRRGDTKAGEKQLEPLQTRTQILNDILDQAGLQPSDKDALLLKRQLDQRVEQWQADTGRKATNEDIRSMADDLTMSVVLQPGSWANIFPGGAPFFDQTKKGYAITYSDIPPAERTKVEQKLRAAGLPVTQDSVVSTYLSVKRHMQETP